VRRETANVLLVLLGGALLKIAWNDTYLRYVKPSLLPFLVATGVVIVALGCSRSPATSGLDVTVVVSGAAPPASSLWAVTRCA